MKHGAIVLMDALGFKGIWRRSPAAQVIARMKALEGELGQLVSSFSVAFAGVTLRRAGRLALSLDPHVAFLSDTVVMALSADGTLLGYQAAIQMLARGVARVSEAAVADEPHLAFRGCIASGEFLVDGNFIIGPAVDEAAGLMNEAEAGVMWLAPSAMEHLHPIPAANLATSLVPATVPLKSGRMEETLVARYFDPFAPRVPDVRDRILATYASPSAEVQKKRANTEWLFAQIDAASVAYDYVLPALAIPGTTVTGGHELANNTMEEIPILTIGGEPYRGPT